MLLNKEHLNKKKLGVKILGYNPKTQNIKFVNHKGDSNETH